MFLHCHFPSGFDRRRSHWFAHEVDFLESRSQSPHCHHLKWSLQESCLFQVASFEHHWFRSQRLIRWCYLHPKCHPIHLEAWMWEFFQNHPVEEYFQTQFPHLELQPFQGHSPQSMQWRCWCKKTDRSLRSEPKFVPPYRSGEMSHFQELLKI